MKIRFRRYTFLGPRHRLQGFPEAPPLFHHISWEIFLSFQDKVFEKFPDYLVVRPLRDIASQS
jgi:hypothetical protein